ncbi:hypothetical protein DFJ43DRAFT_1035169 [Lentinula guzmanii]|uniref:Uncharacterized protein n=1 Tax=Lentinula guzmanii TaxID=2804957 RepID=A0AA38JXL3_9AGAR|nr:hypothetical protein DFJ43DRAFT_1035169 [Lentinula guzmanii]
MNHMLKFCCPKQRVAIFIKCTYQCLCWLVVWNLDKHNMELLSNPSNFARDIPVGHSRTHLYNVINALTKLTALTVSNTIESHMTMIAVVRLDNTKARLVLEASNIIPVPLLIGTLDSKSNPSYLRDIMVEYPTKHYGKSEKDRSNAVFEDPQIENNCWPQLLNAPTSFPRMADKIKLGQGPAQRSSQHVSMRDMVGGFEIDGAIHIIKLDSYNLCAALKKDNMVWVEAEDLGEDMEDGENEFEEFDHATVQPSSNDAHPAKVSNPIRFIQEFKGDLKTAS